MVTGSDRTRRCTEEGLQRMPVRPYKVRVRPRAGTLARLITIGNSSTGHAGDRSLRPAVMSSGEQNTIEALAYTASTQHIGF